MTDLALCTSTDSAITDAKSQLPRAVGATDFAWIGPKYVGKVRDSYIRGEERFLIAKDTLSAFDYVLCTIPWKGEVLNRVARYWFDRTQHIVPNHVLAYPDPNVVRARECKMIPIEVVVRGFLVGSSLRDYQAGRLVSGVRLPSGLRPHEKLPQPILTPSTKAPVGEHDMPISEQEIVESGRVSKVLWEKVRSVALELFQFASDDAAKRGLIFADTKYEFGLIGEELYLADEIHTPDSSRIWNAVTYPERFEAGLAPEMLDKEPIRLWLNSSIKFKNGDPLPVLPDDFRAHVAVHYLSAARRIIGDEFHPRSGDVLPEIEASIRKAISV